MVLNLKTYKEAPTSVIDRYANLKPSVSATRLHELKATHSYFPQNDTKITVTERDPRTVAEQTFGQDNFIICG